MAGELVWELAESFADRDVWRTLMPLNSVEIATAWLPTSGYGTITVQAESVGETALSTAVVTLERGNNRRYKGYGLESATTITAEGITVSRAVDGFAYIRASCTTAEASVEVELIACLTKREFS